MKILQIKGYGDIKSNLSFSEIEKPTISDNQVLIEVYAASINPIDYKIVEGALKQIRKLTFPAPIGFDVSGVVIKKGNNVNHLNVGDEIYSRVPSDSPGTFSEFIAINADVVCLKPSNLDFIESSSLPLVGLTTIQSFNKANLKSGDKVLIHAGSGGIGTFAIQYAKSKGAYVYTTTSTKNVNWVKELGADRVIDYKTENYLKEFYDLSNTTDIKGFYYETRLHSVIVLEISLASFSQNHPVSFEYLCETIPKKLGKRTTIQTILNEGLRKGYFIKTLNEKDKRIKFYTLEKNSLDVIEKWWIDRKEFSTV